jgi:hypothetical protein
MCLAQFGTDERCIKVRHTPQHADSLLLSILPLCCTAWLVLLPYSIAVAQQEWQQQQQQQQQQLGQYQFVVAG